MKLSIPANFSWRECLFSLDRGYDEVLYKVNDHCVRRAILLEGSPVVVQISQEDHLLNIDLLMGHKSPQQEEQIAAYVTHWFDLDRDLTPFYNLINREPVVKDFLPRYQGLRLIGIPELFEALCWCIIGQQINLTFAHQIKSRLVKSLGQQVLVDGEEYHIFPSPKQVLDAPDSALQDMKFSRQKMKYIKIVAAAIEHHLISVDKLQGLPDFDARKNALMALKGIGPWTANYVLMKTLREPDCIPYGDTGLIAGLKRIGVIEHKKELDKLEAFFDDFVGWKSYLSFYIWRSLYEPRDD